MKRLFILILSVIYSSAASGASFHMHFCSGYLVNVSLFDHSEEGCCKDQNHHADEQDFRISKKCCANETASLQIKAHQVVKKCSAPINLHCVGISANVQEILRPAPAFAASPPSWHSPPGRETMSVYLVNCCIRV